MRQVDPEHQLMNDTKHVLNSSPLVELMLAHWVKITVISVAFALAGLCASLLFSPVYRAEVLLAPILPDGDRMLKTAGSTYLEMAGVIGPGLLTQERAQLVASLTSREFTYEFIRTKGLLPQLFPDDWDAAARKWRRSATADTPTMWQAYELFDKSVRSVHLDEESGLVKLAVEWSDPKTAASWANSLVECADQHLRSQAVSEGKRSMEYLSEELRTTSTDEIRDAIYSLMEMELRSVMLASVKDEYAYKVLDPAVAPGDPVRPNRRVMALAGLLLGFCVGMIAAASSRSGRTGVTEQKDARRME